MKRILLITSCFLLVVGLSAQTITQKLQNAFTTFEKDTQLTHAISSLYVIDAQTGQVVFDKNSRIGLAPASTQKIITSVTAFELLGKDFKYKTELGYKTGKSGFSDVYIRSHGDPTFGSFRYVQTKPETILKNFYEKLTASGFKNGMAILYIDNLNFEAKIIPDGWIWEDIGNYYGAGALALNWHENQYDITLKSSDKVGSKVDVIAINGKKDFKGSFINEVKAAANNSGDNAYIYFPIGNSDYVVRGTIPVNENNFTISGAINEPGSFFAKEFGDIIRTKQKNISGESLTGYMYAKQVPDIVPSYIHYSPSLDSIIYWFNKKSINLYGEALVKTFAYEKQGFGSTDSGVAIVKKFWKEKGLSDKELNISDGSGLSPLNRVTTHAQVEILKYAKTKDWFQYFYNSLPEYNGMKIKSGTIRDVKGFCGYHKAKNGKEYIFSFLVNNYNGSAGELVKKMYKVLDVLK